MYRGFKMMLAASAALAGAGSAYAFDLAPPPGYILDVGAVAGTTTAAYTQFSTTFTANQGVTYVSFLFRRDPSYFAFDDAAVTLGTSGPNLLVDPGFEDGPVGSQVPVGWGNFQQTAGIGAQGVVATGGGRGGEGPHSGNNFWDDGAVGAYDGIYQSIATVVGQQYTLSFWLANPSSGSPYSQTGNGIDVLAYAGADLPGGTIIITPAPPPPSVPEPATWATMVGGFGLIGGALRRRRRISVNFA